MDSTLQAKMMALLCDPLCVPDDSRERKPMPWMSRWGLGLPRTARNTIYIGHWTDNMEREKFCLHSSRRPSVACPVPLHRRFDANYVQIMDLLLFSIWQRKMYLFFGWIRIRFAQSNIGTFVRCVCECTLPARRFNNVFWEGVWEQSLAANPVLFSPFRKKYCGYAN